MHHARHLKHMLLHLQLKTLELRLGDLHAQDIHLSGLQKPLWAQVHLTLKQMLPSPAFTSKSIAVWLSQCMGSSSGGINCDADEGLTEDEVATKTGREHWHIYFSLNPSPRTGKPQGLCVFHSILELVPPNTAMNYNRWYWLKPAVGTANPLLSYKPQTVGRTLPSYLQVASLQEYPADTQKEQCST